MILLHGSSEGFHIDDSDSGHRRLRLAVEGETISGSLRSGPLRGVRRPVAHDGVDRPHPLQGRCFQRALVLHAPGQAFHQVFSVVYPFDLPKELHEKMSRFLSGLLPLRYPQ